MNISANSNTTIAAVATAPGAGGLAVIRISGPNAFSIVDKLWHGTSIIGMASHTAHLGRITDLNGNLLDQAVATVFRAPNSFTGEDTVELSLHGSLWIQRQVMAALIDAGAVPAGHGEFSQRAFFNGRLDLAQAEAIADLIAASSKAAHTLAMRQMSGEFSSRLNSLRDRLVEFASLLELELDFSEEDVEFADRSKLVETARETLRIVDNLSDSYRMGKAFKEGVPVAIAGAPNVGKSTLLNALVGDEKAIVSDIPGTTRDVIEDTAEIGGTLFRFFDTAGLRDTDDRVEQIGISRARDRISKAAIILWLADSTAPDSLHDQSALTPISLHTPADPNILTPTDSGIPAPKQLLIINKSDLLATNPSGIRTPRPEADAAPATNTKEVTATADAIPTMYISAKTGEGLDELKRWLADAGISEADPEREMIVTNARHAAALAEGSAALRRAIAGLTDGIPTDLVAQDVREALHHLGLITGAVTTPDLLTTIFSRFCIGK